MIKAVWFDLDGTLLPMEEDLFVKEYFSLLSEKLEAFGFEKKKLIATVLEGTNKMKNNNGKQTNEEVFWQHFSEVYGKEVISFKPLLNDFYLNEFAETKKYWKENIYAPEIIMASNPIFPYNAMITRLKFLGLDINDFDYTTYYENSHFAKPSTGYYQEILDNNNLKPEEVIFFGNSEKDDCEASLKLGIKSYLVGDFLKLQTEKPNFEHISLSEITKTIDKELKND